MKNTILRRSLVAALYAVAIATASLAVPPLGPSTAQAQTVEDFQVALEPYGQWRQHPRWGEIWVPYERPRGWRPYTIGHWVYTDDWGWFWVSDEDEEDWGWVTYHYGRWMFERGAGWFWLPGEDWAPAWVDWRYSNEVVGWAPLPPEDVIYEFDDEPGYWVFVSPRYMLAPRWRTYIIPPERRLAVFRTTRIVNRTVVLQGQRLAVNPGIAPAHIAAVTRSSVPAFRVRPRVLAATAAVVAGAVAVSATQLRTGRQQGGQGRQRTNAVSVQQATVIQPANNAAPRALGQGERGHLGPRAPRAAQGAGIQQQVQPQQQQAPKQQQQSPQQQSQPQQQPQQQIQQQPAQSQPAQRREFREQRPEQRPAGGGPAARPGEPAKPQRPTVDQTPPRQGTQNRPDRVQQPGIVRPQTESRPVQQPQQPQQPRVQQQQQPQQPRVQQPVQQQQPKQAAPAKPAEPKKPEAKKKDEKKPEEKK